MEIREPFSKQTCKVIERKSKRTVSEKKRKEKERERKKKRKAKLKISQKKTQFWSNPNRK